MNRNLSAGQFEQPSLPGTERMGYDPQPKAPRQQPKKEPLRGYMSTEYTSAHQMSGAWEPNSVPEPTDVMDVVFRRSPGPHVTEGEFIPSWKVTSQQPRVNRHAVAHQVANANPMALQDDPAVKAYYPADAPGSKIFDEHYDLLDGNHRVNAALRRGQMFLPARVYRKDR